MSNPTDMPQKVDPMKLRGRAFGLGQRNPDTLPGSGKNAESVEQNRRETRSLGSLRKWVQSANSVGAKY